MSIQRTWYGVQISQHESANDWKKIMARETLKTIAERAVGPKE